MNETPHDIQSESGRVLDTVVIGGGQAGLAIAYHLAQQHRDLVILDAHERVGDAWRLRWDSLRLFTPAKYDGLPGMPFPGDRLGFPTKDEQADYLEAYAAHFGLPVRTGVHVDRVRRDGDRFVVEAGARRWEAENVVLATGGYQVPRVPEFAGRLAASVRAAALERLPESRAAAAGPRARRRDGQLGRRDRARRERHARHDHRRHAGRRTARAPRPYGGAVRAPRRAVRRTARAHARDADRTARAAEARRPRRAVDPHEARRPRRRRRRAGRVGWSTSATGRRSRRTATCSTWRTSSGARGTGTT